MLKYICPLIVVEDIERSRYFYEQLLGQKVRYDFGEDVQFEGDFTIHLRSGFQSLLGDAAQYPASRKSHWGELYFETDEIEQISQSLQGAGVEFIHPMREQPWGQRCMRVYDPDGHVLEIGEPMEAAVMRLHRQGLSIQLISERTSMPGEFIERVTKEHASGQPTSG
jgi:catechol 2,3-dioxygenase-like lactoylglutathione lyase family enzyme